MPKQNTNKYQEFYLKDNGGRIPYERWQEFCIDTKVIVLDQQKINYLTKDQRKHNNDNELYLKNDGAEGPI